MRALFCGGSPKSGSWQIRAVQIADMRHDWLAVSDPTKEQIDAAEVIVAIKRVKPELCETLRKSGKPVIWDALDFWRQPVDAIGVDTVEQARALAWPWVQRLKPRCIIAANQAMAGDLDGMAEHVTTIYHHWRPDLSPCMGRHITYEGAPAYLGKWRDTVTEASTSISWGLHYGLAADGITGAILAARDGEHGSWLARRWKSNVKAANAIGACVPLIAWPEDAYVETMPIPAAWFFETDDQLFEVIGHLSDGDMLGGAFSACAKMRDIYSIERIAGQYEKLFASL